MTLIRFSVPLIPEIDLVAKSDVRRPGSFAQTQAASERVRVTEIRVRTGKHPLDPANVLTLAPVRGSNCRRCPSCAPRHTVSPVREKRTEEAYRLSVPDIRSRPEGEPVRHYNRQHHRASNLPKAEPIQISARRERNGVFTHPATPVSLSEGPAGNTSPQFRAEAHPLDQVRNWTGRTPCGARPKERF